MVFNEKLQESLKKELERIDKLGTTKRKERVIEGFSEGKAIINEEKFLVFNSNDYLGLRFDKRILDAEKRASERFGSGPGAVRFISGTSRIHTELEKEIASFHNRESGMIFSSAFSANLSVIHSLLKGQNKDSILGEDSIIFGDELNHRCIIDGIRLANLSSERKIIYKHLDMKDLRDKIQSSEKRERALLITDGVFSMLGEYANLNEIRKIAKENESKFPQGITIIVDDSHGVASFGETGRGCEEKSKTEAHILVGTFGKGFGVDGGYVVGDKIVIDYLKESAATYIYSNPVSPGTAAACLEAVRIVKKEGKDLIRKLNENIIYFKEKMKEKGFEFVTESEHAIQPVLIGDSNKAKHITEKLFEKNILVTNISYPVVPKGKDEIRIQLSARHSKEDIDYLIKSLKEL